MRAHRGGYIYINNKALIVFRSMWAGGPVFNSSSIAAYGIRLYLC